MRRPSVSEFRMVRGPTRAVPGLAAIIAAALLSLAGCGGTGEDRATAEQEGSLQQIDRVIAQGPFDDSWDSLEAYTPPEWYQDAKFGVFIHWGGYSVPAFWGEWYPRLMYEQGDLVFRHHRSRWGTQDRFGYKDFIPLFRGENFDPNQWADLFQQAGARYVVPVAEHHDGFAMYDTALTEWNAARMGPKRDVIRELAVAVRERGMVFGLSSHRAFHWTYFAGGRQFDSDVNDPRYASLYGPAAPAGTEPDQPFLEDWLLRCADLVDRYHPQILWHDFGIDAPVYAPYNRKLAAYYYNRALDWGKGVVLNYKGSAFPEGTAVLDVERGQLSTIRPEVWQTDTSVSFTSWGYVDFPQIYKSSDRLVDDLVDIVSKNGVLLLNVGPRADGTIPEVESRLLLDVGDWLAVNGEAIYGSSPWKVFGEGPTKPLDLPDPLNLLEEFLAPRLTARDFRFTKNGDTLYAVAMDWPADGRLSIFSLGRGSALAEGEIRSIRLLGHLEPLSWSRDDEALRVSLPDEKPGDYAYVLEIKGLLGPGS